MKVAALWRGQWLFRWPIPLPSEELLARIENLDGTQSVLLLSNYRPDSKELDDQGQLLFVNEWDGAFIITESANVLAVTTLRDVMYRTRNDPSRYTYRCKFTPLALAIDSYRDARITSNSTAHQYADKTVEFGFDTFRIQSAYCGTGL